MFKTSFGRRLRHAIAMCFGMAISLYATAGVAQVTGGLITGKYGQDQVYDVQRSPANPVTGNTFTVSSFARPLPDTGFTRYTLGTDYIQFFDNGGPAEGSVGIRRYTSGDVLVETISAGGCISGISTQGFLYVSTVGNRGTWISNGAAYPLGGSLTYTPTGPAGACATDAELNAFVASTVVVSSTPTPTVTSLAPASGEGSGGQTVVITGTNLTGATAVVFGGRAASSFTVNSATQITATTPISSFAGVVDVRVTTPDGTSANTAADNYTYLSAIPTLSEWAMILFGLLLAGGAALYIQRRQLTA
ncbi:IPT/TIG domain-containing protein [Brevundimonas sp.]|uniref:IPT/TIG domain-containing protein n=1 Tax=Brevundimonas sp. TaxID=1871086 RepID=UPI002627CBA0|nr:IPT/TIG domain-containing protein [Brevundimonas sp.]